MSPAPPGAGLMLCWGKNSDLGEGQTKLTFKLIEDLVAFGHGKAAALNPVRGVPTTEATYIFMSIML